MKLTLRESFGRYVVFLKIPDTIWIHYIAVKSEHNVIVTSQAVIKRSSPLSRQPSCYHVLLHSPNQLSCIRYVSLCSKKTFLTILQMQN